MLSNYPSRDVADKLFEGFKYGFKLQYTGPRVSVVCKNLLSAYQHSAQLLEKVNKEVQLGRIGGPYREPPISNSRLNAVGLVEKSDSSWRLITHLSHPPLPER